MCSPTSIAFCDEPLALDHVERGQRGRARHRPAAEGAAEVADCETRRRWPACATTAPIGSPDASPLAIVRMSGTTPNASAAREGAAAADAALDLVEDQQRAALVA